MYGNLTGISLLFAGLQHQPADKQIIIWRSQHKVLYYAGYFEELFTHLFDASMSPALLQRSFATALLKIFAHSRQDHFRWMCFLKMFSKTLIFRLLCLALGASSIDALLDTDSFTRLIKFFFLAGDGIASQDFTSGKDSRFTYEKATL